MVYCFEFASLSLDFYTLRISEVLLKLTQGYFPVSLCFGLLETSFPPDLVSTSLSWMDKLDVK